MRKGKLRKGLVVAIIVLFVGVSVVPSISGDIEKLNDISEVKDTVMLEKLQSFIAEYHSVYGFVYIDDMLAPSGVEVKLSFPTGDESDFTNSNGYYQIDFEGHDWEEGEFSVNYAGDWYTPVDNQSVEIEPDIISYNIDLHINTSSPPDTVYVDDDFNESTPGWGYDHFDNIQDGVDAVNESGLVYVYNGTYNENVEIDKSINLVGEDRNTTIIDSAGGADAVYISISADWVNISGFTIRDADANCNGIGIRSNFNSISGNNIVSNDYFGVYFYDSNNNTISNNNISENGAQGLRLEQSSFNMICENRITQNLDDGIALNYDSNNNTVINNYIADNADDGIQIYESNTNLILKNEIIENIETGIQITENSNNNQLYHNNIINNTLQANDLCNNYWDNGYPSGGNYWSDYIGDDLYNGPNQDILGSDGIGDTPYNISGGDNQDLYPLMHPFELYYILNISAPPEVNEGELFNVFVTSMGGPVVPLATVEFNDELKFSDSDGRVYFSAPQVGADTFYDITATKEGYTADTETILVKDVPDEFESVFMFGRITNLDVTDEYITFNAVNVRVIKFSPFQFLGCTSGEKISIYKDFQGYLGALLGVQFIFAKCDAYIG